MLLDQQNVFTDGTLATGASNTDVIDMGAATNLGALALGRGHGGEGAEIVTNCLGPKGNADNTLAYNLVGADDAAFTVNKITVLAVAAYNVTIKTNNHARVPHHTPKRYFRLENTVAGTTASLPGTKQFLHTTANERPLAGGPSVI